MRFDDSIDTVLAADMDGPAAVEWTWRQLVDLIGRRQSAGPSRARDDALDRLRAIRPQVSRAARLAAARGLERADPPAALVALFIDQELAIAAPVVRNARLNDDEWIALLPAMLPATRGVLRLRDDLSSAVIGALVAYGPTDFALHGEPTLAGPALMPEQAVAPSVEPSVNELGAPSFVPPDPDPFVAVADVARAIPVVAEAIRHEEHGPLADPVLEDNPSAAATANREDFEIPALVARIAAHQRTLDDRTRPNMVVPVSVPTRFQFETDVNGLIRWVGGVERGPLIGLSLLAGRDGRPTTVDGVAAGAFARRGRFSDARLEVAGNSDAGGSWRISGAPLFDHASGRFTGYRGTARRPRADEAAHAANPATGDALRQLVHELRTPANAISGFAEMIEHQLLGPVPDAYRAQAASIRNQTGGLLEVIDDLDVAARIETRRLDLRDERVPLMPLIDRIAAQLESLATLRGATLELTGEDAVATGDAVAIERLLTRFLTAVVASARPGERITGRITGDGEIIVVSMTRPAAFVDPRGALFEADAEAEAEAAAEDGPLLGTGFGFRLARRLATELGGSLSVEADALTLRLPAAVERGVEQATV